MHISFPLLVHSGLGGKKIKILPQNLLTSRSLSEHFVVSVDLRLIKDTRHIDRAEESAIATNYYLKGSEEMTTQNRMSGKYKYLCFKGHFSLHTSEKKKQKHKMLNPHGV